MMRRFALVSVVLIATATIGAVTAASAPQDSPVIVAAGDISIAGGAQGATAATIASIDPDAVLPLGDNQYPTGSLADFETYYDPTWGAFLSITNPAPGNHEYLTENAEGYFDYFGIRAPGEYYSYDVGAWHLISLNSEIAHSVHSAQVTWLLSDLQEHEQRCVLAYWHKPRFSSGHNGNYSSMQPFWAALAKAHAEVVLVGHDHDYERFAPMDIHGKAVVSGIREFVVGTGGAALEEFEDIKANSLVRNNTDHGVLELTLNPRNYQWIFQSSDGSFTDQGSASCH
jgi:hypothetical protein